MSPPSPLTFHKIGWSTLAGLAVVYCMAALATVATSLDIRVRCLLTDSVPKDNENSGLEVRSTEGLGDVGRHIYGEHPDAGDSLILLGGHPIGSFVDLCRALSEIRDRRLTSGETIEPGVDPVELEEEDRQFANSTITVLQERSGLKVVKAVFEREGRSFVSWLPMEPQPTLGLTVTIVWALIQLGVLTVAGLAHWRRPYDRSLRLFFISAVVSLVALVGGSYWWVIAESLWLLLPFTVAAILLPAVMLHFFLLYPVPRRWLSQRAGLVLSGVYLLPAAAAAGGAAIILLGAWLSPTAMASAPLDGVYQRMSSAWTSGLLQQLCGGISAYVVVSAGYFLLSIGSLAHAFVHSRQRVEHDQVRWILAAAVVALGPLGYALWLASTDSVSLVFGGGQVPIFAASLLFTIAYAVGIIRHRLMLIDQVLHRGLLYYLASFGLMLVFAAAVAYGTMSMEKKVAGGFAQPAFVFVVATAAVIALLWLRDRLQVGIDREFFREKYQLDKSLQRVNQAVTSMVDRRTLADRVLNSCHEVLQANRGAIYLRDEPSRIFYRLTSFGEGAFPAEFSASREFVETLRSGLSLQRLRSGDSPIQQSMRVLDAELVHGLDVDGALAGMVVLGGKPNGASYSAEDAAFLTAMGRMAGVTLHFGRVHDELTRMNADFVRLNDELGQRAAAVEDLQKQVVELRGAMQERDESLAQSQRQVDALQVQLRIQQSDEPAEAEPAFAAETILGSSRPIRSVLDTVRKVAASEASVLVRGESGTGKELLARAIHNNSRRRDGPLVTIHCAALAPGVLESELFGHVRGAFTDARQDKQGRFHLANGGTLFLDEIGDVPLETQVKLLRVLQERVIEPVGSSQQIPVDVRLIAATHRNLEEFIAAGRFREDLYYRLNVVSITLPPLRERGDDVVELAVRFLKRATQRTGKGVSYFDEPVLEVLRSHAWPGNIRELENVVERAVVLAEHDRITLEDLPPSLRSNPSGRPGGPDLRAGGPASSASVGARRLNPPDAWNGAAAGAAPELRSDGGVIVIGSDEERRMLQDALDKAGGNKASAARLLGMPRSTYFSKLRKHGLE